MSGWQGSPDRGQNAQARVAALEAELAAERAALSAERAENERLRTAYLPVSYSFHP